MATCPTCGNEMDLQVMKPYSNAMSRYVDPSTKKLDGVYNSQEDYITVKGKKLMREGLDEAKAKDSKAVEISTHPAGRPIISPVTHGDPDLVEVPHPDTMQESIDPVGTPISPNPVLINRVRQAPVATSNVIPLQGNMAGVAQEGDATGKPTPPPNKPNPTPNPTGANRPSPAGMKSVSDTPQQRDPNPTGQTHAHADGGQKSAPTAQPIKPNPPVQPVKTPTQPAQTAK